MTIEWPYEAVLEELDGLECCETLLDLAFSTFKSLGINSFLYAFLPRDAHYCRDAINVHHRGFSEGQKIFPDQLKALAGTDAGAKYMKLKVASSASPFTERDRLAEKLFSTASPSNSIHFEIWKNQKGLFVPVHSARFKSGIFCLPPFSDDMDSKLMRKIQLMCQGFHNKYCELWRMPETRQIKLTDREQDVLIWITLGKSNAVIADILGLSKHTIDSYVRRVFLKLGVNDRVSAALKAHDIGLLQDNVIRASEAHKWAEDDPDN